MKYFGIRHVLDIDFRVTGEEYSCLNRSINASGNVHYSEIRSTAMMAIADEINWPTHSFWKFIRFSKSRAKIPSTEDTHGSSDMKLYPFSIDTNIWPNALCDCLSRVLRDARVACGQCRWHMM
jgi:hypothetical protein